MTAQTPDTDTPPPAEVPPTWLEIARVWASTAYQIARHVEQREAEDPGFGHLQAVVQGMGKHQFEAAQMASFMALVSIAEDLHAIAGTLTHVGQVVAADTRARRTRTPGESRGGGEDDEL